MAQTPQQVMQQAAFYSNNQPYVLIGLPPGAIMAAAGVVAEIGEPFCALVVDKDEVSLLIPAEAWEDFQDRLPGGKIGDRTYRLITIDLPLEPDLIGFIAYVSAALAEANVPILTFAAFSRDHFFVPDDRFAAAMEALDRLKRL
ncbi:MAG TPA: ACT domain-containing protein [Spirillospora sp.]|nr:ACT domain-containing protein [Spirillospora sp.]